MCQSKGKKVDVQKQKAAVEDLKTVFEAADYLQNNINRSLMWDMTKQSDLHYSIIKLERSKALTELIVDLEAADWDVQKLFDNIVHKPVDQGKETLNETLEKFELTI